MTADELAAIIEGIAPVIRDCVQQAAFTCSVGLAVTDKEVAHLATAVAELGTVRERVAVLETRAPVPGPPGPAGMHGVGFDDLVVEQVDETTIAVHAIRGDVVKEIGKVTFPFARVKGDYKPGQEYLPGNLVRHQRAIWLCKKATTIAPGSVTHDATGKPAGPQGQDFWTLWLADGRR